MWYNISLCLLFITLVVSHADQLVSEFKMLPNLSANALSKLPVEILHLVKAERLSELPGDALAAVVREKHDNQVLVGKCLMAARTERQRESFLKTLIGSHILSERVQAEIAAYLVHWYRDTESWKFQRFMQTKETGSPLLAYLPRTFLYSLSRADQTKFVYHLRDWHWTTSREQQWSLKPRSLRRSWAEIMVNLPFPAPLQELSYQQLQAHGFLLIGATSDELSQLRLISSDSRKYILNLPLEPLQARTAFKVSFRRLKNRNPPIEQFITPLPMLTPVQMQSLDLNHVNLSSVGASELDIKYKPSWASSVQMAYCLMEQNTILNNIWKDGWSVDAFAHVGVWLYALPRVTLARVFSANPALVNDVIRLRDIRKEKVLKALGKAPLSGWQARLFVGHHLKSQPMDLEFLSRLRGRLLLAFPASTMAHASISQISQSILKHLLTYLPRDSTSLFPLYLKVRGSLVRSWSLDAILESQDPDQFLDMLGSEDIGRIAEFLRDAIGKNSHTKILSRRTLGIALGHLLRGNTSTSANLKAPKLLAGLRCEDIRNLDSESLMPVLSTMGSLLQEEGVRYPRDLQYCALSSLLEYVHARSKMHNLLTPILDFVTENKKKSQTVLDEFEPAEVSAIGGYILASIPPPLINSSVRWQHIVFSIGRLSVVELLEIFADKNIEGDKLASLAFRVEPKEAGLATLELLGNLVQFISNPEQLALRLNPRAFRLWVEGMKRRQDTSLCVSTIPRNTYWYRSIVRAYGLPKIWSAGILDTLGGLLLAVPSTALDQVPQKSWIEAADQLNAHNPYTKHFMKLCGNFLGNQLAYEHKQTVHALMRRFLEASQKLMLTVRKRNLVVKEPDTSRTTTTLIKFDPNFLARFKLPVLGARPKRENENTPWFEIIPEDSNTTETSINNTTLLSTTAMPSTTSEPKERAQIVERPDIEIEESLDTPINFNSTDDSMSTTLTPAMTPHTPFDHSTSVTQFDDTFSTHIPDLRNTSITAAYSSNLITTLAPTDSPSSTTLIISSTLQTELVNMTTKPVKENNTLSCGAVRMATVAASMVLTEEDLETLAEVGELEECLEVLGTLDFYSATTTAAVWNIIKKRDLKIDLRDMGALLSQADFDIIRKSNLSDLDVITAIGRHLENWSQMGKIVSLILEVNNITERMTEEVASSLGTMTCGLISLGTGGQFLQPTAFLKLYPLLSKLLGRTARCPPQSCLRELFMIAENPLVHGHRSQWTTEDVTSLGIIIAGMNSKEIGQLKSGSEHGISSEAVRCMSHELLQGLSLQQIRNMSLKALHEVTPRMMEKLESKQRSAILSSLSPPPHPLLKITEKSIDVPSSTASCANNISIPKSIIIIWFVMMFKIIILS